MICMASRANHAKTDSNLTKVSITNNQDESFVWIVNPNINTVYEQARRSTDFNIINCDGHGYYQHSDQ